MSDAAANPYRHRPSAIHRLPASVKLAAAAACVLTAVLVPPHAWAVFAALGAALLAAAIASTVPFGHLLRRLALAEPFALGIALLALVQVDGLRLFLAMVVRSTLCLFSLVLLTSTTRFTDLLRVFRRLRVPALLLVILALMQRYLFVLADEARRLIRARRSRTFVRGRRREWRHSAGVAAQLFLQSSERAERVYDAMCARGWKP